MKVIKWLDTNIEIYLVNFLLANIAIWVFIQVILRYVFSYSLPWSEELVRWCFVWLIWVGVSYAFKVRKHICIDFIVKKLPIKIAGIIEIIVNIVILWFMAKMTLLGFEQIVSPIIRNQDSIVLFWPISGNNVSMFWLYASLPFGAFLSSVRLIQNLLTDMKNLFGHPSLN